MAAFFIQSMCISKANSWCAVSKNSRSRNLEENQVIGKGCSNEIVGYFKIITRNSISVAPNLAVRCDYVSIPSSTSTCQVIDYVNISRFQPYANIYIGFCKKK